jgi:hypothetical protein
MYCNWMGSIITNSLGFGVIRFAHRKGRRGGHTWSVLVAGKGICEDPIAPPRKTSEDILLIEKGTGERNRDDAEP